jgi:hypothetical protein
MTDENVEYERQTMMRVYDSDRVRIKILAAKHNLSMGEMLTDVLDAYDEYLMAKQENKNG